MKIYKTILSPFIKSFLVGKNQHSELKSGQIYQKCKKYVDAIQNMIETKISVISTGPERSQTIDKDNI